MELPAPKPPLFGEYATEVLAFLEDFAWPLRLDLLIQQERERANPDEQARALLAEIEANPAILGEWLGLPAPAKKESDGDSAASMTAMERIRIYGLQRTRTYLVGAKLRHRFPVDAKAKGENWIANPMPSWALVGRIFADEEADRELRLECALMIAFFFRWLDEGSRKGDAPRVRRWLEQRSDAWAKLWRFLEEGAKSGDAQPIGMILKSQILFDLGRASLVALSDQVPNFWTVAEKENEALPISLWKESLVFGFSSAQIASIWAQSLGSSSGLVTPLRLLTRPWRSSHPQVKLTHAKTAQYLASWAVRKSA